MLYKGDTLYLDWLEDGIAELVFDAPVQLINRHCDHQPGEATSACYSNQI